MTDKTPTISVIVPNYNSGLYLEACLKSIYAQEGPVELIVIDGGSTDESAETIRKYKEQIDACVIERDDGQTDAINKGLRLATGALVCWQNADDVYLPGAFRVVRELYRDAPPDCAMFCGNTVCIDAEGNILSLQKGWRPTLERLAVEGYIISSQATFWRREVDGFMNALDKRFDHAMDMELWLRLLQNRSARFTDAYLGAFRIHPGTKTSTNGHVGTTEFYELIRDLGFDPDSLTYRLQRARYRAARLGRHYLSCAMLSRPESPIT